MKKLAIVFLVAVLAPSVVLALLAMRSLRDQEIVVQSQLALLHQRHTDSLAADLRIATDDIRSYFGILVDELVENNQPTNLCNDFDSLVRSHWGQALAACVVTEEGQWVAPSEDSTEPRVQEFLRDNRLFLTNNIVAEVYQAPQPMGNLIQLETMEYRSDPPLATAGGADDEVQPQRTPQTELRSQQRSVQSPQQGRAPAPADTGQTKSQPQGDSEMPAPAGGTASNGSVELVAADAAAEAAPPPLRRKVVPISGKMGSVQNRAGGQQVQQAERVVPAQELADQGSDQAEKAPAQPLLEPATAAPEVSAANLDPDVLLPEVQSGGRSNVAQQQQTQRSVEPFSQLDYNGWERAAQTAEKALGDYDNAKRLSSFNAASGEVRDIIGDQREGALSRFLEDGLHVLLWYRHPAVESRIFWVELDLEEIRSDLAAIVDLSGQSDPDSDVCVALLDAESRPVARTVGDFSTDWKRPFVASEVGEILPHWEVAAYFLNPSKVASSARTARLTLWLLVPILLSAIGFGSLMIFRDVGREMQAARKKTDFVSNVSHELKTPLTSIRMFSDLLEKKDDVEADKRQNYAGIISTEAARLTRLINNLLDFSRMERGEKKYDKSDFDAVALAGEVVENYRLQIESEGIALSFEDRIGEPAMVSGDRDALAQVLLNLLSNAEKYGASGGKIRVEARRAADAGEVEIRVLDRGPGISRREAARIFEKFYRVDDSLSTGIQGSGLGLTLARQIAQGHDGEVECCTRDDGERGACFALRLPLISDNDPDPKTE